MEERLSRFEEILREVLTDGMIIPLQNTPFDDESWVFTVEYATDGHLSRDDAADIDNSALFALMQNDTAFSNNERRLQGYQ